MKGSDEPQIGPDGAGGFGGRGGLARLLTTREVGELLSVSERTVRRLTHRGLRSIRLGGVVRFDPADVRRFLAARRG